jgi:hypothetical protein
MDETFKQSLRSFFKREWEYKQGSADDFIYDFEEWINKEGFDLSCILQYKIKK